MSVPLSVPLGVPLSVLLSEAMQAGDILGQLHAQGAQVTSLCADSRRLHPGDTFVAYPGHGGRVDGRQYIPAALASGARAVLWEREGFAWQPHWQLPNVGVNSLKPLVGAIASQVYGIPSQSLFMAGVTGTNGKTSVSQWIAQALTTCGRPCGVVGTLGARFGAIDSPMPNTAPNTTPDAIELQQLLRKMVDAGAAGCAMEVSSIGLDQARVGGVAFDCAVFTNFTRDHLDYHGSMAAYEAAKTRLFRSEGLPAAVINLDDAMGIRLMARTADRIDRIAYCIDGKSPVVELVEDEGRLTASALKFDASGVRFMVASDWGRAEVAAPVWGEFNVSNLLAVLGVLMLAGIPLHQAVDALAKINPVPGRMNALGGSGEPLVVIDYAHTPDALEKALTSLRPLAESRGGALRVVFGCGGDRDAGKRPLMGAVAEKCADTVMLTSDNPRSEMPEAILRQIAQGMAGPHLVEADRAAAITRAVGAAASVDVILIAGKGHESWQEVAGRKLPFSDHDVARTALQDRNSRSRSLPA